jgi:LuxR family transcriptional regulator, maltose regulon positive regulatory protein
MRMGFTPSESAFMIARSHNQRSAKDSHVIVVADFLRLLVPTKLLAPHPLATWVQRARLLTRLSASSQARLILVVAPAGFGKSTLVTQWLLESVSDEGLALQVGSASAEPPASLPAQPSSFAWLTLDEHDQNPLSFLTYIVGAIDRVAPGLLSATLDLLNDTDTPPPYLLLQALLVDLSALPLHLTLVLDDYHLIAAEPIHQAVAYLLRHLPAHCRLVIISRTDPALPLGRLRAERQIAELRAADLRFTTAEIDALLTGLTGAAPSAAQVALLQQQTEGWAIALQLAATAALGGASSGLGTATRQITEYLADEVLAQQTPEAQQTLLTLAIPERFCARLCAALLDLPTTPITGEQRLDQLVRANLFLIPLDEEQRWYRFHHLFRGLLLRHATLVLGEHSVRDLHRRTAHWLTAEGLIEEALRHLLSAGDEDAATGLIERRFVPALEHDARCLSELDAVYKDGDLWPGYTATSLGQAAYGRSELSTAATEALSASRHAQPIPALPAPAIPELLTRRESEILALLARRWSDKEIATELVIASNTVRKHTSTIYQKLGVSSRREAVATARALGLLPAEPV